ncbi:MAG: site-2 protease family protein [Patescibacteria group bacterium]|jgi:Zn-dependent protease
MNREISIGKISGVEIALDYSWFWIFLLVSFSFATNLLPILQPGRSLFVYGVLGVLASVMFFGSVILHELSHTLSARSNNLPVKKITLFLFGGASNLTKEPSSPLTEFKMAVAGPLASIAIAGALFGAGDLILLANNTNLIAMLIQSIGFINLLLAGFNLLPGFPLDGGRILRSLLWWRSGDMIRATRYASSIGKLIAGAMIIFGVLQSFGGNLFGGIWLAMIGLFLWSAASSSLAQSVVHALLRDASIESVMSGEDRALQPGATLRDLSEREELSHKHRYPIGNRDGIMGYINSAALNGVPQEEWSKTKVTSRAKRINKELCVMAKETAEDVVSVFYQNDVIAVPVCEEKRVVGLVFPEDIKRYLRNRVKQD